MLDGGDEVFRSSLGIVLTSSHLLHLLSILTYPCIARGVFYIQQQFHDQCGVTGERLLTKKASGLQWSLKFVILFYQTGLVVHMQPHR